jgi:formate dehydrogenase maturation protein FdhE
MTKQPVPTKQWDRRIERARHLASLYPFAREILVFYSKLATFQKGLYLDLYSSRATQAAETQPCHSEGRSDEESASGVKPLRRSRLLSHACGIGMTGGGTSVPIGGLKAHVKLRMISKKPFPPACTAAGNDGVLPLDPDKLDLTFLMPRFPSFLCMLEHEGPVALRDFARELADRGPDAWSEVLTSVRRREEPEHLDSAQGRCPSGSASFEWFCARAFLQPALEYLAGREGLTPHGARVSVCPFCGSKPVAGVLRPEGEGAKRSLICALCRTEWDYVRIACPACEESREERLCVYKTPQFEHVRVEACDTCHTYLNTIDLARNGLAVPEVDELAAVPLALWADEHGYRKVTRNLLGL